MELKEGDIASIDNLLKFVSEGTFELKGSDVPSMNHSLNWLAGFRNALVVQLQEQKESKIQKESMKIKKKKGMKSGTK